MKTVIELREDLRRRKQEAEGITANQTVQQLEEIQVQIAEAHEQAVANGYTTTSISTQLDLTAQAQATLEENGYRVEELPYGRGEEEPFLYSISWTY